MIVFSPVRTKRIVANLREMTADDAIFLCQMRADMNESGTTALLQRIVSEENNPRIAQVTDVRLWTVQERALAVSHYIAHTNGGDPNFKVGTDGHYSDYLLDGPNCAPDSLAAGEVGGDKWIAYPLLGIHAESIERLVVSGRLEAKRYGWWIGAMAAQLFVEGDDADHSGLTDTELDDLIESRIKVFRAYPDSEFFNMLSLFLSANESMTHLFNLTFTDDGIAFSAKEAGLPPARFPFDSALSNSAKTVFGNA